MGRQHREYWLPLFSGFRMVSVFKHREDVPDEVVNAEYMAENSWFVGSPDTSWITSPKQLADSELYLLRLMIMPIILMYGKTL
jgi:hypothetical protein